MIEKLAIFAAAEFQRRHRNFVKRNEAKARARGVAFFAIFVIVRFIICTTAVAAGLCGYWYQKTHVGFTGGG